jgi:hypothetical protein
MRAPSRLPACRSSICCIARIVNRHESLTASRQKSVRLGRRTSRAQSERPSRSGRGIGREAKVFHRGEMRIGGYHVPDSQPHRSSCGATLPDNGCRDLSRRGRRARGDKNRGNSERKTCGRFGCVVWRPAHSASRLGCGVKSASSNDVVGAPNAGERARISLTMILRGEQEPKAVKGSFPLWRSRLPRADRVSRGLALGTPP